MRDLAEVLQAIRDAAGVHFSGDDSIVYTEDGEEIVITSGDHSSIVRVRGNDLDFTMRKSEAWPILDAVHDLPQV